MLYKHWFIVSIVKFSWEGFLFNYTLIRLKAPEVLFYWSYEIIEDEIFYWCILATEPISVTMNPICFYSATCFWKRRPYLYLTAMRWWDLMGCGVHETVRCFIKRINISMISRNFHSELSSKRNFSLRLMLTSALNKTGTCLQEKSHLDSGLHSDIGLEFLLVDELRAA